MARNIWVTSDTHFNHSNIIRYCDRPFRGSREMDETLVDNWNSVVKEQDKVYHLGDVYMGASRGYITTLLSRLKGHKRLILGNHDNGLDENLRRYFDKILMWGMFPEFGLLFSHVPVHPSALKAKELTNIHGHIHQNKSPEGPYRNVCVEWTNYTPIHIEELRTR